MEEVLWYVTSIEKDQKISVLDQQIDAMSSGEVGEKVYPPELMGRAFEYFATS